MKLSTEMQVALELREENIRHHGLFGIHGAGDIATARFR
jgi:hypothetical protein